MRTNTTITQVQARMENAKFAVFNAIDHALEASSEEEYKKWVDIGVHHAKDYEIWHKVYNAIKDL